MRVLPVVIALSAVGGLLAWTFWPTKSAVGVSSGTNTALPAARANGPSAAPSGPTRTPRASDPLTETLRGDRRIAELIFSCSKTGWYDRDTSDTIPILIEKLREGQVTPLQRAKEELSGLGDPAMVEVERMFRQSFSDPMAAGVLQNTIDVASMAGGDLAHDLLIQCLDHPRDAVRGLAADALARRHARSDDFDRLLLQLDAEPPDGRRRVTRALATADPLRAQRLFVDWVCTRTRPEVWEELVPLLWSARDPETCERAKGCWREASLYVRTELIALAIRAGDSEALAALETDLHAPEPERRSKAIQAAIELERWDDVGQALLGDPHGVVRHIALSGLARAAGEARVLPWIEQVSQEPLGELSDSALGLLLQWHAASAEDRLIGDLEGPRNLVERALRLLVPLLEQRPDLAQRVWDALQRVALAEQGLPLEQRLTTLQSIGLVPRAAAAQLLREAAFAAPAELRLKNLRPHEWLMIQASNTGTEGRAWLATQLDAEQDPLRRIDLIWAISAQRCDGEAGPCLGRDKLLQLIETEGLHPLEVLYAASRLVRLGPSQVIAPRLKRAVLRITEPEARLALECLLWTWY
jgi:hypothetical protein